MFIVESSLPDFYQSSSPSALDIPKYQRWLSMIRSGNFDLFDLSGKSTGLDNDEVEVNPHQTIEKLSNIFDQPWSTIQENYNRLEK